MRAAPTGRDARGVAWQPPGAANPVVWGMVALATAAIVAELLPWKEALVALLALGPVLAIARADLDARIVPDIWVLALAALGLNVAIASPEDGWLDVGEALMRGNGMRRGGGGCVASCRAHHWRSPIA